MELILIITKAFLKNSSVSLSTIKTNATRQNIYHRKRERAIERGAYIVQEYMSRSVFCDIDWYTHDPLCAFVTDSSLRMVQLFLTFFLALDRSLIIA